MQENEDTVRFDTFMQLLRTAGALDRAATDALADLDLTAGAFGALMELGQVGEAASPRPNLPGGSPWPGAPPRCTSIS